MILVVDCGNTDTVLGLYEGTIQKHVWRMPSSEALNHQTWSYRIASELMEQACTPSDIHQSVLSSVVPDLTAALTVSLENLTGKSVRVLNPDLYEILDIKVVNTVEIGTDLVANAVAAYDRFRQKCLIVDFGTALTLTTVRDDGELAGVAITPGLRTAVKSLLQHTAQLPEVPLKMPVSVLGKNTIEAIQAGVMIGYTGMVRHLVKQVKKEMGPELKVIATGGLCEALEELEDLFDVRDRHLTLQGLVWIGMHQK